MEMISSQGFDYGERERVEKMGKSLALSMGKFLSILIWKLGLKSMGNDEYLGWI